MSTPRFSRGRRPAPAGNEKDGDLRVAFLPVFQKHGRFVENNGMFTVVIFCFTFDVGKAAVVRRGVMDSRE